MEYHLVIIGNGFDLAHGLKTSYSDFFKKLVDEHFDDLFDLRAKGMIYSISDYEKLLPHIKKGEFTIPFQNSFKVYWKLIAQGLPPKAQPMFKDPLIAELIFDFAINKWCDIEAKYFELLTTEDEKSPFYWSTELLNDKFQALKEHLEEYLIEEQTKTTALDSYREFFKAINSERTLILNFNYTHTIEKLYSKETSNCKHLHIHGEVANENNPLIFGYAALHEESRKLLLKNKNEYLRNIKKHLYKRTSNEHQLSEFLSFSLPSISHRNAIRSSVHTSILGHSCGISDNLILNQILNHENIHQGCPSIRVFYYNEYENYRDTLINIDRIMNDDERFRSFIINYQDSDRMPQYNDKESINDFKNFFAQHRDTIVIP